VVGFLDFIEAFSSFAIFLPSAFAYFLTVALADGEAAFFFIAIMDLASQEAYNVCVNIPPNENKLLIYANEIRVLASKMVEKTLELMQKRREKDLVRSRLRTNEPSPYRQSDLQAIV